MHLVSWFTRTLSVSCVRLKRMKLATSRVLVWKASGVLGLGMSLQTP